MGEKQRLETRSSGEQLLAPLSGFPKHMHCFGPVNRRYGISTPVRAMRLQRGRMGMGPEFVGLCGVQTSASPEFKLSFNLLQK